VDNKTQDKMQLNLKTRFVLNTKFSDTPASKICHIALSNHLRKAGFPVTLNNWDNYGQYDVAIFMSNDPDIKRAKKQNPNILTGLADPKTSVHTEDARQSDFLLVSSYEQRDRFLKHNVNIFIYYMFPEVKQLLRSHIEKKKIIIGYHGNKIHLNCLYPHVILAMEKLSRYYEVEFWALYNYEILGKWSIGLPDPSKVKVRHINLQPEWPADNYEEVTSKIDLGIVPALLPMKKPRVVNLLSRRSKRSFLENSNDYITRYKCSSGPARIYVFSMLGIPVVTDFFPSGARVIDHGVTGFIACSAEGWFDAFYQLASDYELRNRVAKNSYEFFKNYEDPDIIFNNFLRFLDLTLTRKRNMNTTFEAEELKTDVLRDISYNIDIKAEQYIAPYIRRAKKLYNLIKDRKR